VRPELYTAMVARPAAWLAVAVVLAGAWALFTGLRGPREDRAFAGSCAVIAGLLAGAAASVFPVMLLSTLAPEHSITAYNGAAATRGLGLALLWWPIALVLAFGYFTVLLRNYRGKVRPADDTQGSY
jgi:cytochrome bd-type quinol oxidase subunit 2